MNRTISEVARLAGVSARTLRHYDAIGLLAPSRRGASGYRHYDDEALLRLQRILLLRDLGLALPVIAAVLEGEADHVHSLRAHLAWLRREKERLDRQIAGVEGTITRLEREERPMPEEMFDGFDHTAYRDEVEQRWGAETYSQSDTWWRSMSPGEKAEWMARQSRLAEDWSTAARAGLPVDGDAAQALAARHYDWLTGIPGTPTTDSGLPSVDYVLGLGEMYVADARFAANYGGVDGARFVRDALAVFIGQRS